MELQASLVSLHTLVSIFVASASAPSSDSEKEKAKFKVVVKGKRFGIQNLTLKIISICKYGTSTCILTALCSSL